MTAPASPGKRVVAVAGPTCSGKSALALHLAQAGRGVVINADSMQVYRDLRILTARPTHAEEASVPHRLYGIRPASEAGNVAWWCARARTEIDAAHEAGLLPILCGGTGLYFAALTDGLADIPDPGEAARAEARALLAAHGPGHLHALLAARDPDTAAGLRPSDSQRLARAWEVLAGTGRSLAAWQDDARPRTENWSWSAIVLDPPRETLRAAVADRFTAMIAAGALDEVRALSAQNLDPALPAMRAHGVPELRAHLAGDIALDVAIHRACLATGQYTKRQSTWFRHRHIADGAHTHRLNARISSQTKFNDEIMAIVDNVLAQRG